MGHRDSSEALGGRGALCVSRSRVGAPAPELGPERGAPGELSRVARVLLFAVRVYQTFFSALMPSACKFYPTCSHYAAEAVRLHGARRGSWLALRRLLRCHPFTRGGVDLVPDPTEPPDKGASREGVCLDSQATPSGAKAPLPMQTLMARLKPCPTKLVVPAQSLTPRPTGIVVYPQALKCSCDNLNILVGRGFSHDIKPAISVSALAPENLKRSYHTDSLKPRSTKLAVPAETYDPRWQEPEGHL